MTDRTFKPTSAARLDELAKVTAADMDAAVARWTKTAPLGMRNLLDATPADGTIPHQPETIPPKGRTIPEKP